MRDYRVTFLADATGTASEEMHIATLRNLAFGFARISLAKDILKEIIENQTDAVRVND